MNETETFWNQLFQDKPIAEDRLQSIKLNVMRHILENPLDFQGQSLLAARKRWGLILLGLLTIGGLVPVLVIYFKGYVLVSLLENLLWLISGFLPGSWINYFWENIEPKVILITDIKLVIEFLWYNYSWYLISIPVLFVVMNRSGSKTMRLPENN